VRRLRLVGSVQFRNAGRVVLQRVEPQLDVVAEILQGFDRALTRDASILQPYGIAPERGGRSRRRGFPLSACRSTPAAAAARGWATLGPRSRGRRVHDAFRRLGGRPRIDARRRQAMSRRSD
jgi:hypothetical protein